MTDVALKWINGEADIAVNDADLLMDDGLESAVALSLACDARAESSDVLPVGEPTRRGWWGDEFSSVEGDRSGCKLWLLFREPRTAATLERAKGYIKQALQWLIDDGIASSIECAASFEDFATLTNSNVRPDQFALVMQIGIKKPDGTSETFRFARQWAAQSERID